MKVQCPYCSAEFNPTAKRRRSVPAHRRFFALVRAAYEHWPEKHPFQPIGPAALRTFLQMQAGWVDQVQSSATGEIYLIPRSIAFDKMTQSEHNQLCERIENYLHRLGIDPEKALKSLHAA